MQLQEIIYLTITVVSALFGVIMWVRRPQEKGETNDALFNQRLDIYEKTTNDAVKLALNHSHTVETKLDLHITQSNLKSIEDAKWQGKVEQMLIDISKK